MPVRTLLIDNYDSYTYNLFQLIAEVRGVVPEVIHNDQLTWAELSQVLLDGKYDNIVISPGPGTPESPQDIGVCGELLRANLQLPILGVCMGMQALAVIHGATIQHAPEPIHGRLSQIQHTGHRLFHDIPSGVDSGFAVVRYHSLAICEKSLPAHLEPIAWTCGSHQPLRQAADKAAVPDSTHVSQAEAKAADRVLQGIAHTQLPYYGVQFHPESIGTAFGRQLLQNFHDITADWHGYQIPPYIMPPSKEPFATALPSSPWQHVGGSASLEVRWQKLEGLLSDVGGPEGLFMHLFGQEGAKDTFWLDSSASDRGRFSYFGGRGGPLWQRISYQLPTPSQPLEHPSISQASSHPWGTPSADAPLMPSSKSAESQQRLTADSGARSSGQTASQGQPGLVQDAPVHSLQARRTTQQQPGTLTIEHSSRSITQQQVSIWDYLRAQLDQHRIQINDEMAQQLPFDFWGGYVGYLGYELKAECGGDNVHQAATPDAAMFLADRFVAVDHHSNDVFLVTLVQPQSETSEAAAQQWLHSTRTTIQTMLSNIPLSSHRGAVGFGSSSSLAGSSQTHQHMDTASSDVAMSDDDWSHRDQRGSFGSLDSLLTDQITHSAVEAEQHHPECGDKHVQPCGTGESPEDSSHPQQADTSKTYKQPVACTDAIPPFRLARSEQQYLRDVAACQQALHDGDSYEICLTTALLRTHPIDALHLYKTLRKVNPAPYAAWMSFGMDDLQICCSSPERFLKGGRGGLLEARPIKGTAPRAADPEQDRAAALALANSEKDQAENLMIVDLLRNDLGRVCQVGSVHVPGLMEVESFATVHQLVSTIRGQRHSSVSLIDAIQAAFPGGSMTGAPKVRSMQILDDLEKEARGIYSGSIGFIGFNDTCDLNIVIRTAIVHGGVTRIGAGGAIVVQSDTHGEYEEMRLKAMALLKAVSLSEGQNPSEAASRVDVGAS